MIASPPPLIEVRNLIKRYRLRASALRWTTMTAVDDVSLDARAGKFLALIGESGCGKSSIGRCILRLLDVDGGSISFRGNRIDSLSQSDFRPLRREIQFVFQSPLTSFDPMLTLRQALLEALRLRDDLSRLEREATVEPLLERVGLPARFADRYPRQVSGGELQRAGIARAIAPAPSFLFLDEPTSALDMSIQGQVVNLLQDLQEERRLSYMLASHDLRVVRHVADEICVMYLGQIVESGTAQQVLERPAHPYTRGLLDATHVGESALRADARVRLRGELALADHEVRGCRLAPRCPFAVARCREEPQEPKAIEPGHFVRCWRSVEGEI
jgi:oligopeptide/dipeptide ABC transporter ATP-binding protein